ncbi:HNH endonuclease family protein [Streptomyces sp. DH24]|uniref:HNH endonuclease family protein n=1 Tax=Streptomyces sp. DH24 TaxID=3040123 RepID=UPI002441AA4E|nr:HNH endonuclease family protein [Streptomyces sp. DH24]MDG9719122.1 HNH endonuclease family protein [Streptomyces sp. DH24]
MRLRGGRAVVAVVTVFAVAGCTDGTTGASGPQDTAGRGGPALAAAESLTVKGRALRTGYDRDRFGSPWADTDSNDCGTRDDILRRDLEDVRFGDGRCKVTAGTLDPDPYTGRDVTFARGRSQVDVDHIVALSDAWQKGARGWDDGKRIAFANDPLNLLAVDAGTNRSKGDGDTASWLPPNKAYRCTYVAAQVAVKKKYGLWVTAAEKAAMKRVLSRCPEQRLPSGGNPTKAPPRFRAD